MPNLGVSLSRFQILKDFCHARLQCQKLIQDKKIITSSIWIFLTVASIQVEAFDQQDLDV